MSSPKSGPYSLPAEQPDPADHGPSLDLSAGDALLRRLELTVRNKLDGLLQGNYLGLVPGPGSEAGESRQYVLGDDVRRMDWPVTARTTTPHIRQTVADRELETWLTVDLSPSMDFGTGRSEKRELVLAAVTAITQLTVRGGNRVGAIVANGSDSFVIPAAGGRNVFARTLEQLRRPQRRRGLVAVDSDFMDGGTDPNIEMAWERSLRALVGRHQLLAVEILDPRELELPAAGLVTFVDPETGRQLEVQTSDRKVRERDAVTAEQQRARIATSLRHAGAAHLQLRTDRDWVSDVVRFVIARRQFLSGAVGAGAR